MEQTLKGGSYNLLNSRNTETVKSEVTSLVKRHNLDFLCLQEANTYTDVLKDIPGYTYIHDSKTWSGKESTLLVRSNLTVDRINFFVYGDGWYTKNKTHHPATGQTNARIDGWLLVRSIHLPTPSHWTFGRISGRVPRNRRDDLIAAVLGLRRFFRWPSIINARLAAGDWNEPPTTHGQYAPAWLAQNTGAVASVPQSKLGHGHIDWVLVKGAVVTKIFKDTDIREGSDHEPVVFTVVRNDLIVSRMRRRRRR